MGRLVAAVLSCFVTLAVAGIDGSIATEEYAPSAVSPDDADPIVPLIGAPPPLERGLLIGENTPIWIASRPDAEPVNYTRYGNGIIREAIHQYRYLKRNSRGKRNINDYDYINYDKDVSKTKRSTSEFVEYSFLVVMDYKKAWPVLESHQKEEVKRKIVYAIAFYNALNIQLRHIQRPGIRLRIAGIVIGVEKKAMPYLRSSETLTGMDRMQATSNARAYWKDMSKSNEFHYNNWNFLAIMTDSEPQKAKDQNLANKPYWSWDFMPYGNDVGGKRLFLFNDDSAFRALPAGGWMNMKPIADMMLDIARWIPVSGNEPYGKLLDTDFLPGDIIPIYMQCEKRGWEETARPCTKENDRPCQQLKCANNHWYSKCGNSGPALVGTVCSADKKKICLDGECRDIPVAFVRS